MARSTFTRIAAITLKTAIILVNPSMRDRFDAVHEWAAEILPTEPQNEVPIRDLQRQIDSAIDKAASYLEDIRTVEYRNVPGNDIEAGLAEVNTVLHASFELFQADQMIGTALTPSDVVFRLQGKLEAQWADQPIPDGVKDFSRTVLVAACYQLVNWVREIPNIQNRVAWQTLTNTWVLTTSTTEILRELRQTGLVGARDAGRVVNSQRRDIATVLGKMDLFGMPVESRFRRTPFAISYVPARITPSGEESPPAVSFDALISKALGSRDSGGMRLLVEGRAGSGKTTAAQWLVYQSATGQFDDRDERLTKTIPFFVRLRNAVRNESAIPADSSLLISGQLREGLGADWLESLAPYQPLIVLDGWDEVSAAARSLAADWLTSLCDRFPQGHIIVTTRPEGSSDPVFHQRHFTTVKMALLREEDKLEITKRWYLGLRANLAQSPDLDEIYLNTAQDQLLRDIRAPGLAMLATTPLLVAMLCCLYATSSRRSPVSKSALYETVISVLIHHRDRDRGVKTGIWDDLQASQKEDFLGAIALAMSEAGVLHLPLKRDGSRGGGSIEDIARMVLPSLGMEQSAATALSKVSLERSMVLQDVGDSEGEFIHRSFQDYFTGGLLARRRETSMLFELARNRMHLGVLPFAVRAADQQTAREIVEWIIFEIDHCTNEEFRTLAFTAVECLDAITALPPAVRSEAIRAIGPLFPPENSDEAAALGTVGDAAVDFLRVGKESRLEQYCIEALIRIGTRRAIEALGEYAQVRGRVVQGALIAGWDLMPEKDYAEIVLSKIAGGLTVKAHSARQMQSLPSIISLSSATIDGINLSSGLLEQLASLHTLRDLTISRCQGLNDCRSLQRLESLHTLQLTDMEDLTTIDRISHAKLRHLSLRNLKLRGIEWSDAIGHLHDLRALWIEAVEWKYGSSFVQVAAPGNATLSRLPLLKTLVVDLGTGSADNSFIDRLPNLSVLRLSKWVDADDLNRIGSLKMLRSVSLAFDEARAHHIDFSPLVPLSALQDMRLHHVILREDCQLFKLKNLTSLRCSDCRILAVDSAFFPGSLRHLEFFRCTALESSTRRQVFEHLESIIWQGPGLVDLDFLRNFPRLQQFEILDATDLADLKGVESLPAGCRGRITGVRTSVSTAPISRAQMNGCAIRYEPHASWEGRVVGEPYHEITWGPVS